MLYERERGKTYSDIINSWYFIKTLRWVYISSWCCSILQVAYVFLLFNPKNNNNTLNYFSSTFFLNTCIDFYVWIKKTLAFPWLGMFINHCDFCDSINFVQKENIKRAFYKWCGHLLKLYFVFQSDKVEYNVYYIYFSFCKWI